MHQSKFLSHYRKIILLVNALSAVGAAKQYFTRVRSKQSFDPFYDKSVVIAENYDIGRPELPRTRRRPPCFNVGSDLHNFLSPKEYFHQMYFKACDPLCGELEKRFCDQQIPSILAIEKTLLNAANGLRSYSRRNKEILPQG